MKVFVTGASGFIGTAVVQELLDAGHQVLGLARSDNAAKTITSLGAKAVPGQLENPHSLQVAAKQADAVIHLAFIHDFARYQQAAVIDQQAIKAIGEALAGTVKPFVVTAGILGLPAPGGVITEADRAINLPRSSEASALQLAEEGIHTSVIRLAPSVHDRHDHGFVPYIIQRAKIQGVSAYPGDGRQRWPAIHRRDAANLFRLAIEKAARGALYNGVAEQGLEVKSIAQQIAERLNIPCQSLTGEQLEEHFGWMTRFISYDSPASNEQTRQQLNWEAQEIGLLEDMDKNYFDQ